MQSQPLCLPLQQHHHQTQCDLQKIGLFGTSADWTDHVAPGALAAAPVIAHVKLAIAVIGLNNQGH